MEVDVELELEEWLLDDDELETLELDEELDDELETLELDDDELLDELETLELDEELDDDDTLELDEELEDRKSVV